MELTEFTGEALMEIRVRPVERSEETQYQEQMARHHYLGSLAKIGETVWYVAIWREQSRLRPRGQDRARRCSTAEEGGHSGGPRPAQLRED